MSRRQIMIGAAAALVLIILGAVGALFNPKPPPVPPSAAEVTRESAEKAGATVAPTVDK